jgi:hypothetical protein
VSPRCWWQPSGADEVQHDTLVGALVIVGVILFSSDNSGIPDR